MSVVAEHLASLVLGSCEDPTWAGFPEITKAAVRAVARNVSNEGNRRRRLVPNRDEGGFAGLESQGEMDAVAGWRCACSVCLYLHM